MTLSGRQSHISGLFRLFMLCSLIAVCAAAQAQTLPASAGPVDFTTVPTGDLLTKNTDGSVTVTTPVGNVYRYYIDANKGLQIQMTKFVGLEPLTSAPVVAQPVGASEPAGYDPEHFLGPTGIRQVKTLGLPASSGKATHGVWIAQVYGAYVSLNAGATWNVDASGVVHIQSPPADFFGETVTYTVESKNDGTTVSTQTVSSASGTVSTTTTTTNAAGNERTETHESDGSDSIHVNALDGRVIMFIEPPDENGRRQFWVVRVWKKVGSATWSSERGIFVAPNFALAQVDPLDSRIAKVIADKVAEGPPSDAKWEADPSATGATGAASPPAVGEGLDPLLKESIEDVDAYLTSLNNDMRLPEVPDWPHAPSSDPLVSSFHIDFLDSAIGATRNVSDMLCAPDRSDASVVCAVDAAGPGRHLANLIFTVPTDGVLRPAIITVRKSSGSYSVTGLIGRSWIAVPGVPLEPRETLRIDFSRFMPRDGSVAAPNTASTPAELPRRRQRLPSRFMLRGQTVTIGAQGANSTPFVRPILFLDQPSGAGATGPTTIASALGLDSYYGAWSMTHPSAVTGGSKLKYILPIAAGGAAAGVLLTKKGSTPSPSTCTFSVSPASINAASGGETDTVSINLSPSGCSPNAWTASSSSSSITVSPSSGNGSGQVTLAVAANTGGPPHIVAVTVAGQTITVNQAASPVCTAISASPNPVTPPSGGGTQSVSVTITPAGCAPNTWSVAATTNPATFITAITPGTGSGNASFVFAASPNTTGATRSGTLTITNPSPSTANVTLSLPVSQPSTACTFTVNASAAHVAPSGGNITVTVTNTQNCPWTASFNPNPSGMLSFIGGGATATGQGTSTLMVNVSPLPPSITARTGAVIITGVGTSTPSGAVNVTQP